MVAPYVAARIENSCSQRLPFLGNHSAMVLILAEKTSVSPQAGAATCPNSCNLCAALSVSHHGGRDGAREGCSDVAR